MGFRLITLLSAQNIQIYGVNQGLMEIQRTEFKSLQAGTLKLEIYPSGEAAGAAAARAAAEAMRQLDRQTPYPSTIGVIFATGASQLATLRVLTSMPDLPWSRITGFHMDEYVGISPDHFASFRKYMREHLAGRVHMHEFNEVSGNAEDLDAYCKEYAAKLRAANPQLCLLGIGENGHLAFNDPAEADFDDPQDVKLVKLDNECRQQQVAEGWFPSIQSVPARAITLTIPTLFRVPRLIASVVGSRKAKIVRRVVDGQISAACPATILKTHPNATVYLDAESSAELGDLLA